MQAVLNPLIYIAVALVVWQCYRLRTWHRRYWGVSLFSPWRMSTVQLVAGVVVGAVLSAGFVLVHWDFGLTASHMWWLWASLLVLGIVRTRFMSLSYVAGLLGLGVLMSEWVGLTSLHPVMLALQDIDVANLLLFTGLMTVISGLLTMWLGGRTYYPLLLPRRGKPVGAIAMQSLWAIPIMFPSADGWFILPVLLTYTDLALTRPREARARLSGLTTITFGLTVALIAWVSLTVHAFVWVAAVWSLIGQECVVWWARRQERYRTAKYRMSKDGIGVLAVKNGSPADLMGIVPGDTITVTNGQAVSDVTELYVALQRSPAFCKLEVTDEHGEKRMVQRSRYAGEPHQLGIVPIEETARAIGESPYRSGWWQYITRKTHYKRQTPDTSLEQ